MVNLISKCSCSSVQRGQATRLLNIFVCSTQLSTKIIMLKNVKMLTIVDILTFISMINITSEGV